MFKTPRPFGGKHRFIVAFNRPQKEDCYHTDIEECDNKILCPGCKKDTTCDPFFQTCAFKSASPKCKECLFNVIAERNTEKYFVLLSNANFKYKHILRMLPREMTYALIHQRGWMNGECECGNVSICDLELIRTFIASTCAHCTLTHMETCRQDHSSINKYQLRKWGLAMIPIPRHVVEDPYWMRYENRLLKVSKKERPTLNFLFENAGRLAELDLLPMIEEKIDYMCDKIEQLESHIEEIKDALHFNNESETPN